jgi:hypothetical protein
MNNIDNELRHRLKNWADQQPLPEGGKAKLMAAAASMKIKAKDESRINFSEQPSDLLVWAMVYSNERRMSMARLVA